MATLFTDDCRWLVVADSVPQLCERQKIALTKLEEWKERNYVAFDNLKNEAIAVRRRRKPELKMRIAETRFTVHRHTMSFNTEDTRWLRVYLNSGLQFRVHKNLTLEKARRT